VDEGLEENLRTFFQLDYPVTQLLFGVADPKDPAIPIVEKLLAEFPKQDARLVVGTPAFGLNPKVENLAAMQRYRRHDVILISDSNVRVAPSYLRETACYLADPRVGLVTNVFTGVGEHQLGATLENLQLNGFVAGNVAMASTIGVTCVVGKSMLMPEKVLDQIGGFAGVRNLLAEDQAIGLRVRKAGYAIEPSCHRERQQPPRSHLVPQPPFAVVQNSAQNGSGLFSLGADDEPFGRGDCLGSFRRNGHRLGRIGGSFWTRRRPRRLPKSLASRLFSKAAAFAAQPDQGPVPPADLV